MYEICVCSVYMCVRETTLMYLHTDAYTRKLSSFLMFSVFSFCFLFNLHAIITATYPDTRSRTPKYAPIALAFHIPSVYVFYLFSFVNIYNIYIYIYMYIFIFVYCWDIFLCIIHRNRCRNELLCSFFFLLSFFHFDYICIISFFFYLFSCTIIIINE